MSVPGVTSAPAPTRLPRPITRTVEDDRAHADQAEVLDRARVNDRGVTDRAVVADRRAGEVARHVNDGVVLDRRARADPDRHHVAAHDGAVPDRATPRRSRHRRSPRRSRRGTRRCPICGRLPANVRIVAADLATLRARVLGLLDRGEQLVERRRRDRRSPARSARRTARCRGSRSTMKWMRSASSIASSLEVDRVGDARAARSS